MGDTLVITFDSMVDCLPGQTVNVHTILQNTFKGFTFMVSDPETSQCFDVLSVYVGVMRQMIPILNMSAFDLRFKSVRDLPYLCMDECNIGQSITVFARNKGVSSHRFLARMVGDVVTTRSTDVAHVKHVKEGLLAWHKSSSDGIIRNGYPDEPVRVFDKLPNGYPDEG